MKCLAVIVAICGGTGSSLVFAGQPGRPLNVLFIMTDEQHFRSLSSTGNRYVSTPNMDRLGREGARFENATCVTPYCSPSRKSELGGIPGQCRRIAASAATLS